MIEKTTNITPGKMTGTAQIGTTKEAAPLQKGMLVNVEALERIGKQYKILINGKLYQSNLPVQMKKGEEFTARVASVNPMVLTLTEFEANDAAQLKALSILLGLEKSGSKNSLLEKVIASKKVLSKKKMRQLIDIVEHYKNEIDELQLSLLIHLIWSENETDPQLFDDDFKKVFDVSFKELCNQIFEQVKTLIELKIPAPILQKINHTMIYDLDKPEKINTLKDKSKGFIELISFVNAVAGSADLPFIEINELKKIRKLLLKYILQKAVYASAGLYPDFTIVNYNHPYSLVYFMFMANGDMPEVTKLISEFELKNLGEVKLNSFFVNNEFKGKIEIEKNPVFMEGEIKLLNRILKKDLNIDSGLFYEKETSSDASLIQRSFRNFDYTA